MEPDIKNTITYLERCVRAIRNGFPMPLKTMEESVKQIPEMLETIKMCQRLITFEAEMQAEKMRSGPWHWEKHVR